MNRRRLLQLSTLPALVALSGCSEYVHRARGVETPADLVVRNQSGDLQTIALEMKRDGDRVFDGTVELDEDGSVQRIEGDDFREVEFTEAGTYAFVVDATGTRKRTESELSWRDLADCNTNTLEVTVHEDEIRAGLSRTDAGCSFPDTL
ncbi:hypothetical protein [Natronorubrum daqingense]|uniref:Lipoprotein n=1 Tax=Natronorubrum daqingense TaxID=588898 RepID=A0A1N7BMC1_9EURY|nr:hypothetical protein [Natronorubrum daqingense]APX96520.1 hypothetical protein BB347_07770 [Natronorubrum daqingense]SIR52511.1 hypothetical protein SAMN05421809_1267 [Natronorubrum daqingense]